MLKGFKDLSPTFWFAFQYDFLEINYYIFKALRKKYWLYIKATDQVIDVFRIEIVSQLKDFNSFQIGTLTDDRHLHCALDKARFRIFFSLVFFAFFAFG